MTGALAHYLEAALAGAPPLAASDGTAIAAGALHELAREIAGELAGIAPDEPVLVAIANEPGDLARLLGVWLAGGVAVPVAADAAPATMQALEAATGARLRLARGGTERIGGVPPPARDLLRDAALVIFTSGSTGRPKGVVIGHAPMAAKLGVLQRLVGLAPGDRVLVPLRLTFIFGLWVSLLALAARARLVLVPRFTTAGVAQDLAGGATVLAAVPTMLRALVAEAAPPAPALRLILTGGETLGVALGARLRASLPQAGICDLYGLTETGSCDFCLRPAEHEAGAGSIGSPTEQVTFRLLTPEGRPAAEGADGELAVRTPFGMLGYLDDPDLTARSHSDGFFRTGDLARLRPDGRVEIVGRLKDIVSRGGNKISPAEIDALIASHPDVAAALCAGVPDARLGEALHAVVVPRAGARIEPEALRRWLAERTERYKVPDAIHVRDSLPVGSTGKVRRTGVAELARDGSGPDGGGR